MGCIVDQIRTCHDNACIVDVWEMGATEMSHKLTCFTPKQFVDYMIALLHTSMCPNSDIMYYRFRAYLLLYLESGSKYLKDYNRNYSFCLEQLVFGSFSHSRDVMMDYMTTYSNQQGYEKYNTITLIDDFLYMIGTTIDRKSFGYYGGFSDFCWVLYNYLCSCETTAKIYREIRTDKSKLTLSDVCF